MAEAKSRPCNLSIMNESTASTLGATSLRPVKPWQIYMLRGERWIGVGACGSRAMAESQAQTLRSKMKGYRFDVVWEGEANG